MTKGLLGQIQTEFPFYQSFERPTRTKWRKGCSARSRQNFYFTTVLSVPTRTKWPKGRRTKWQICILPQFWAFDTHEVTKGLLGDGKKLHFTIVLSIRHARSDERVSRRRDKIAFYHGFERPTRTKWRKGRSASSRICILPQFWASVMHEVTRGLSNPQVRSLCPDRKKNIF